MRSLRFIVQLAAASVIGLSLLPLAARAWWGFELTANFRLQYVVAGFVLLVLLALLRRPLWCAALAGSIVFSAWPLAAYPPIPGLGATRAAAAATARAAASPAALTIATANLFFRNSQVARLVPILRAASPDLVVLEEFTPAAQAELQELRAAYPYRVEAPDDTPYGIALLSRCALGSARTFPLGTTRAIEAQVTGPGGRFTIVGVHLRSPTSRESAAERNRELTMLAALRAEIRGPLVVIGDFNTTPFSPFFTDWLAASKLRDARRGVSYTATWPSFLPILRIPIDHCFVSHQFRLTALWRLEGFGSDHFPLLVRLELDADEPASSTAKDHSPALERP
jgi:endonuclease/exonuclease/phosphatase (EEP) superfamily protein YafD